VESRVREFERLERFKIPEPDDYLELKINSLKPYKNISAKQIDHGQKDILSEVR
jgi:hypothetical protein